MAVQRIPLLRAEVSGDFDAHESAEIFSLSYAPTYSNPNTPSSGATTTLGVEDAFTNRPIVINDYKLELITDVTTHMYQYYCDDDEKTSANNWSTTSAEFATHLKQHKLAAGNIRSDDAVGAAPRKNTLYYSSKKYWSKKHKMWKWARPPIVLSKNKKNTFGIAINNATELNDRSYYALVTIRNWAYLD